MSVLKKQRSKPFCKQLLKLRQNVQNRSKRFKLQSEKQLKFYRRFKLKNSFRVTITKFASKNNSFQKKYRNFLYKKHFNTVNKAKDTIISKIKKKVLHHLAGQLAYVLYSIKQNYHFPVRYCFILISLISFFIRLFVTKDILISTYGSAFLVWLAHFVVIYYIIAYILPDKKTMDKVIKFIKDNRDSS